MFEDNESELDTCPDCGVAAGAPHKGDCDIQRCSACDGQWIKCRCSGHDPLRSVWTGRWPKGKDSIESVRLSKDGRVSPRKRQCYHNAFSTVMNCDEYAGATYVEGMIVFVGGLTIEHGWIETDDSIIDPTLPNERTVYCPGLTFEGRIGIVNGLKIPKKDSCDDLPFFYRFGWGGHNSPEFNAARKASMRLMNHYCEMNQGKQEEEAVADELVEAC